MAPKKREVFALFELEGLTGEEIAERVGCKVDTVWTRLWHARRDFERIARKRGWAE
jgi:RNA polymerase sigma-70 factor (ECF subfamily)